MSMTRNVAIHVGLSTCMKDARPVSDNVDVELDQFRLIYSVCQTGVAGTRTSHALSVSQSRKFGQLAKAA